MAAWRDTDYGKLQAADHRGWSYDKLAAQLSSATDYTVIGGPYRGMRYFGDPRIPIIDKSPTTKLIGSFEEELHPWIDRFIERGFRDVILIGGGEGYHAVGMARRMPRSKFVVFDTLIAARQACKQLAEQNAVKSRMQLRGFCGAESFYDLEIAGSLIFADCGGAELTLLDPVLYPALRTATLLVETHDAFDPRITPRLVSKFSQTHNIEFTDAVPRNPAKYLLPGKLSPESVKMALDENRKLTRDGRAQRWALFTPMSS